VSCDWSQLVTWYKPVVNRLVPCDLCDHSQISHVVSNDVTSDILLTTLHVITDWPTSDHMIGTSYRGPVRRSMFHWEVCPGSLYSSPCTIQSDSTISIRSTINYVVQRPT
ncbi:unnamed protein product, partial [Staurois parvus]